MLNPKAGLFITLEGVEGVGKSTAAVGLAALLRESGYQVMLTREPGGTKGAEAIRKLILEQSVPLTPMAQTILHFAARADHVEHSIRPALKAGQIVICDRFYDSTIAYQAYGQGVPVSDIQALIKLIRLTPDFTFLLELSEAQSLQRLAARSSGTDRYEEMGSAFFERVRNGFNLLALAEPERFIRIDASMPAHDVAAALHKIVLEKIGQ